MVNLSPTNIGNNDSGVRIGKYKEMALLGHLDVVRLLDRAVRRAALPISFTGGYHPGPRISPANALPLGATSSGEVIDFELTEAMDGALFKHKLEEQLPPEMPIFEVETITLPGPLCHPNSRKSRICHLGSALTLGFRLTSIRPFKPFPSSWDQHPSQSMANMAGPDAGGNRINGLRKPLSRARSNISICAIASLSLHFLAPLNPLAALGKQ